MSPDGRTLAVVRRDGPLVLWDVANGRELGVVPLEARPTSIALSDDGKKVAMSVTDSFASPGNSTAGQPAQILSGWLDLWDVAGKRWDSGFGRKSPTFGPSFSNVSASR